MANGFLLEPAQLASVTASSTATGYLATNVGVDRMGNVWRSATGSATQTLTIDLGADTTLDTITLHGLAGAEATWQWSIDLATAAQGAFSGSFWSGSAEDLLAGSVMPVNGRGRALWLAPGGAPAAARYVRLNFSALSSAAVEVGRVVIGSRVQLSQNFSYGGALGIRDTGSISFSARGVPLVREGARKRGIGLSCEGATRAEVESEIMPMLERVGTTGGVALVVDPDADAQRQNRIYFGPLTGDLGVVWAGYDRFVWQANIVALD